MKFLKVTVHAVSLGLIVESELVIWVNVVALILARSDNKPIATTVYGQQAKLNTLEYVKIVELPTHGTRTYKSTFLSPKNYAMANALVQRELKFRNSVGTQFGFVFLSEFYDCSVIRYRSYSNLVRIELHDLINDLQRTHRNLSTADDLKSSSRCLA
jgi:hypothetical protein